MTAARPPGPTPQRRQFAARVAITRDAGKEGAAEQFARSAGAAPANGRVGEARAPAALGLGEGHKLPSRERTYFERRLGVDLGAVRTHPDAAPVADLGARGLASGRDVAIAPGEWRPGSTGFRRLLGHELAHVLDQGAHGPAVQLDGPPAPAQEPKAAEAVGAVEGGLKTAGEEFGKNQELKKFGKGVAERYALPVWNGLTTGEKIVTAGAGAGMYGLGVGAMLTAPSGRAALSGINLAAPLGIVPFATLQTFSFVPPKLPTDPLVLSFGLKADELLELAHKKAWWLPPMTLSFDMKLAVAPDGSITVPSALASVGLFGEFNLKAGIGTPPVSTTPPGPFGATPYKTFPAPDPGTPTPAAGWGVFFTWDLAKSKALPEPLRNVLTLSTGERK